MKLRYVAPVVCGRIGRGELGQVARGSRGTDSGVGVIADRVHAEPARPLWAIGLSTDAGWVECAAELPQLEHDQAASRSPGPPSVSIVAAERSRQELGVLRSAASGSTGSMLTRSSSDTRASPAQVSISGSGRGPARAAATSRAPSVEVRPAPAAAQGRRTGGHGRPRGSVGSGGKRRNATAEVIASGSVARPPRPELQHLPRPLDRVVEVARVNVRDGVQAELQRGDDAEVAPAARAAPRSRSGFSSAEAVRTSAAVGRHDLRPTRTEPDARPYRRPSQPKPPPIVKPTTPTWELEPGRPASP